MTGGGDCPGLNAVIRAVVRTVANAGGTSIGLMEGWRGLVKGMYRPLTVNETDDIIGRGGTILGSSRTNPYKNPQDVALVRDNIRALGLDAVVAIGGDDTLGVADRLYSDFQLPLVGVPKTIDNDLGVTDFTFGFDTAVNVVTEAVDRLRTTAESHRRIVVVETMGRHAGWIACFSGIATAADYVLVPEVPIDINHMCHVLTKRREQGKLYGIVVVSEGAKFSDTDVVTQDMEVDEFGHVKLGGIGEVIAGLIERRTGIQTRSVTLGHLQRGGSPSAFDRVLATRLGIRAGRLVLERRFGLMVALRGVEIVEVPLADAVRQLKTLELEHYEEAREFFKDVLPSGADT
jgi:6-phosphofructokinase 1